MVDLNQSRLVRILLVEDNEDDMILTRKGFERAQLNVELSWVEDGQSCLDFLNRRGKFENETLPNLILLDLNLPDISGQKVMEQIVQNKELRNIPVVILTTSQAEADVLAMYDLRCSSFIKKPIDFQEFQAVINEICEYWFSVVILPKQDVKPK